VKTPPLQPRAPLRFGTDGVRGAAGQWPLTEEGAMLVGQALADTLRAEQPEATVVIGMDTRRSSPWLARWLESGLRRQGVHVLRAGVLPSAGLSLAVVASRADAGVMITASHNPASDNGIKLMGPDGRKWVGQEALEARLDQALEAAPPPAPIRGSARDLEDPAGPWRAAMPRLDLSGLRLLLDCAHGAAAPHAPALLQSLGAALQLRGCDPDGDNINAAVGALHPPSAAEVAAAGCALALCLDGDADRLLLVDPERGVLDGDDALFLLAAEGQGPVVGTVMSNGGLDAALPGRLLRSPVGDRSVAAKMLESGARFGAEPSGHILFSDGPPTGDGVYAALRLLAVGATEGRPRLPLLSGDGPSPPSEVGVGTSRRRWSRWPLFTRDVRFSGARRSLEGLTSIHSAEAAGNRVVVRYSGTEPLLRILVEGPASPGGEGAPDAGQGPAAWVERIAQEFQS
jgi:phosphoglucosamine mutase